MAHTSVGGPGNDVQFPVVRGGNRRVGERAAAHYSVVAVRRNLVRAEVRIRDAPVMGAAVSALLEGPVPRVVEVLPAVKEDHVTVRTGRIDQQVTALQLVFGERG